MIYTFSTAVILAILAIAATTHRFFIHPSKGVQRFLTFVGMAILTFSSAFAVGLPAIASPSTTLPVLNNAQPLNSQQIFRFEEDLSVSPLGNQCDGLCIAEEFTGFQHDSDLLQAIHEKLTPESDLAVSVANGAVFLAGSAKDEAAVHDLVHQIETIPGVQWITVEIALTHQDQANG